MYRIDRCGFGIAVGARIWICQVRPDTRMGGHPLGLVIVSCDLRVNQRESTAIHFGWRGQWRVGR